MKTKLAVTVCGFASVLLAHHSVPGQYDISKTITIRGVVTRTEWVNPHARFWVDAKNDDGTVATWELELPPPNALKREEGGKLDFVKDGDEVTVTLWRAKDGSRLAHALTLTAPNGRVMNFPRGWGMPANSQ